MNKDSLQNMPRKIPSQRRARATVDCILKAAELIISNEGYEFATTNHIAEVAGVSIGTVYQYFPRKEAILASLIENAVITSSEPLRQILLAHMHTPLAEGVPIQLRMILEGRRKYSKIFKHLPSNLGNSGTNTNLLTPETFLFTTIYMYFKHHHTEIKIDSIDTAMFISEHLVVGAINNYLQDTSPQLNDNEFIAELSNAVTRYLTKQ